MTDIALRSIAKRYGGRQILHDVQFTVPDRSVLALLGPSGCGKSTLLRLIAGFEQVDCGEITFGEMVVASVAQSVPPERRRIGYVPQEGSLFPHLTVAGNTGYGLARRERRGPRVAEVLDLVGLAGFAERYPHELSGGQQQRVALARALAPRPAVILLDEPFNALDLDLRRSMSTEVVSLLRQTQTTAILVTHDPSEAFACADLVAVIESGTVVQCAPPEAVYHAPVSPGVARLTGPAIFLDGIAQGHHVATPLGLIPVHGADIPDGKLVKAMLRPEQFIPCGSDCGFEVQIVRQLFQGDHVLLTLAAAGQSFEVRMPRAVEAATINLRIEGLCRAFAAPQPASTVFASVRP